jgi:hypothetical protein
LILSMMLFLYFFIFFFVLGAALLFCIYILSLFG